MRKCFSRDAAYRGCATCIVVSGCDDATRVVNCAGCDTNSGWRMMPLSPVLIQWRMMPLLSAYTYTL